MPDLSNPPIRTRKRAGITYKYLINLMYLFLNIKIGNHIFLPKSPLIFLLYLSFCYVYFNNRDSKNNF